MSFTTDSPDKQARLMLALYTGHVTQMLYEQMLEEIKPKLKQAAKNAVKEMEPGIRSYLDPMYNAMALQITVKGLDE